MERYDFALVASERSMAAAKQSQEPFVAAIASRQVAQILTDSDTALAAQSVVETAAAELSSASLASRPQVLSAYGGLKLEGAVAASRRGDASQARDYLDEADEAARRLGGHYSDLHLEFGPAAAILKRI